MSLLNKEIELLLTDKLVHKKDENILNAEIEFDRNFIGFDGHFPDNPVLPGVIMIRIMVKMYELHRKMDYALSVIKKAKFAGPVFAGDVVMFSVKADERESGVELSGKVSKSGKNISKVFLGLE